MHPNIILANGIHKKFLCLEVNLAQIENRNKIVFLCGNVPARILAM